MWWDSVASISVRACIIHDDSNIEILYIIISSSPNKTIHFCFVIYVVVNRNFITVIIFVASFSTRKKRNNHKIFTHTRRSVSVCLLLTFMTWIQIDAECIPNILVCTQIEQNHRKNMTFLCNSKFKRKKIIIFDSSVFRYFIPQFT